MCEFSVSPGTGKAIEEIQRVFGVTTNAAVIRKALALALVFVRAADDNHIVRMRGKDGREIRINLVD